MSIESSACGRYIIVRVGGGAAHVLSYVEADDWLDQALGAYDRAVATHVAGLVALARSQVDAWRMALNTAQERRAG